MPPEDVPEHELPDIKVSRAGAAGGWARGSGRVADAD